MKVKLGTFHGFDGKRYTAAQFKRARNGIKVVRYTIPGKGEPFAFTAYLERAEWSRFKPARKKAR